MEIIRQSREAQSGDLAVLELDSVDITPSAGWTPAAGVCGFALVGEYVQGFGSIDLAADAPADTQIVAAAGLPAELRPSVNKQCHAVGSGATFVAGGKATTVLLAVGADGSIALDALTAIADAAAVGKVHLDTVRWIAG